MCGNIRHYEASRDNWSDTKIPVARSDSYNTVKSYLRQASDQDASNLGRFTGKFSTYSL